MLSNSTQSFSKRIMRSMISMGLLVHTGLSNFHLADLAGLGKPWGFDGRIMVPDFSKSFRHPKSHEVTRSHRSWRSWRENLKHRRNRSRTRGVVWHFLEASADQIFRTLDIYLYYIEVPVESSRYICGRWFIQLLMARQHTTTPDLMILRNHP